jgi:hypothetical protein
LTPSACRRPHPGPLLKHYRRRKGGGLQRPGDGGEQLAFSRLLLDATGLSESLMRIDRAGGEPVKLIPLGSVWPLEVTAPMAWLPDDSLLYTRRNVLAPEDPRNGLWRGVPAGTQGAGESRTVQLVAGAADGDVPSPEIHDVHLERGLVSLSSVSRFIDDPSVRPGRVFWLYDPEQEALRALPALEIDGQLAGPTRPVILAPDGALALTLYAADGASHLVVTELATGAMHVLDHPPELAPVGLGRRWTANDLVLVASGEGAR